jgi:alanine-synthesizing transaminase
MALTKIIPARKTNDVKYAIRDIIALADSVAKTGKQMYYLNIGDPNIYDFVTPDTVVNAACDAIRSNKNGYAPSSGIKDALDAIRLDANNKGIFNILDAFVTNGASEAIEICLTALLNQGENFLMPTPGYPLYTAVQSKLELEPNPYYLDESNGWQPDVEDIRGKINSRTRAIVLINPNNPTGSICKPETLLEIVKLAKEHNLVIFADEIYDKLIFDGAKMTSIAALDDEVSCITFSGLSKNYVAPGFRIGWGVVSGKQEILGDYVEAINKLLRSRVSSNHPEQYSIVPALQGDQSHLVDMVTRLERRRDLMIAALAKIDGIDLVPPEGAFYAFPTIKVRDDNHFVTQLINETGVIVVPGSGFGQRPGTSHFRIVTLPQEEVLTKAFALIAEFYSYYRNND